MAIAGASVERVAFLFRTLDSAKYFCTVFSAAVRMPELWKAFSIKLLMTTRITEINFVSGLDATTCHASLKSCATTASDMAWILRTCLWKVSATLADEKTELVESWIWCILHTWTYQRGHRTPCLPPLSTMVWFFVELHPLTTEEHCWMSDRAGDTQRGDDSAPVPHSTLRATYLGNILIAFVSDGVRGPKCDKREGLRNRESGRFNSKETIGGNDTRSRDQFVARCVNRKGKNIHEPSKSKRKVAYLRSRLVMVA